MEAFIEKIDKSRNVKPGTLKVYTTNLRKTWEKLGDGNKFNPNFLKKKQEVIDFTKSLAKATQRTYISSYVVASDVMDDNDLAKFYRDKLAKLKEELDSVMMSGVKSEKQEKNWVGIETLKKVIKTMKRELMDDRVFEKNDLSKRNMRELQDYVIANLYLGDDENPPVRNDYGGMKIITYEDYKKLPDKEKNDSNYLTIKSNTNKFFSFNNYKTFNRYGNKEIKVGKKLNLILNQWLRVNDGDYLLYNERKRAMTAQQLSVRVKEIFKRTGKNITTNLIRSMYVSEKFPRDQQTEREEVASKMGHSVNTQQKVYSKK